MIIANGIVDYCGIVIVQRQCSIAKIHLGRSMQRRQILKQKMRKIAFRIFYYYNF